MPSAFPTELDSRIRQELTAVLERQMPLVLGAGLAVSILCYLTVPRAAKGAWLDVWFLAMLILLTARSAFLLLRLRGHIRLDLEGRAWIYRISSGASGLLFGLFGLLTGVPGDPETLTLAIVVICGMTSGSIGSLTAVTGVYPAFAIPTMVPLVTYLAAADQPEHRLIAVLGAIFLFVNLGYSRNQHGILTESISLRFDRERVVGDLQQARADAEKANRAKGQFLLAAGHDLRQPLFSIRLMLDQLEHARPGEQARDIRALKASTRDISALLDKILTAAKLDLGGYDASIAVTPLAPALAALVAEFRAEAARRGMKIITVNSSLAVHADPVLLGQILRNLVSNALLHSRGTRVLVGLRRKGESAIINVIDDGQGIAPERSDRIFEPFYTTETDARTSTGGHGLGLALVRLMAKATGAEVLVQSQLGQGARFTVKLPLAVIEAAPLPGQAPDQQAARTAARTVRILLVEDNRAVRTALTRTLRSMGHTVRVATNGHAALLKAETGAAPEIIVTDLRLPGEMDGLTFVARLRAASGRVIPAIVLTGDTNAPAADTEQTLVLQKPVDGDALAGSISLLLAAG